MGPRFFGRPISIQVRVETPKREEFEIESHTNESVGEVKLRIAERLKMAVTKLSLVSVGKDGKEEEEVALEDGKGSDGRLVCQVGSCEVRTREGGGHYMKRSREYIIITLFFTPMGLIASACLHV